MLSIAVRKVRLLESKLLHKKTYSTAKNAKTIANTEIQILDKKYQMDEWTNIGEKIIEKIDKNLHVKKYHPLSHIRQRIVNYFYTNYPNKWGNPEFSVHDNLKPVVTVEQNFDSLLTPKDHVSRKKTDCYYINKDLLLRAHTSAHQAELIAMGLNNFLVVGDVYRRDEIDATHYPVFHQIEGVRLCTEAEVFKNVQGCSGLEIFEENGKNSDEKQAIHSLEAVKIMEHELKRDLVGLTQALFGKDIKYRWVNEYFPFTHPSWELEIFYNDKWMEVLGCGIIRDEILKNAGATDRIGWAFGLGLERLAMCLYKIPDIRLFWSQDSGFLHQFEFDDPNTNITYKPVSVFPPVINDISFWLPDNGQFSSNDFYDLVKEIGGDIVEQVKLIDKFDHPKKGKTSNTFRITYRDMERNLTQNEVSLIHNKIREVLMNDFKVTLR